MVAAVEDVPNYNTYNTDINGREWLMKINDNMKHETHKLKR
jgi:hypothetical protein